MERSNMLAVLGAVLQEVEPLFDAMACGRAFPLHGETFRTGNCGGMEVVVGTTGLGKVNAAVTTAALLERLKVTGVLNVGCAGAYNGGPLRVGDVLVTSRFLLGDEGVLLDGECLPGEAIGIPILVQEGKKYFDHLPAGNLALDFLEGTPPGSYEFMEAGSPARVRLLYADGGGWGAGAIGPAKGESGKKTAADAIPGIGGKSFRLFSGPSLTVGMASGDALVARRRFQRYLAYAENMEGSAVAHACLRFGVPVVECRGISNIAGNRRKGDWRLDMAVAHCHGIVLHRIFSPVGEGDGSGCRAWAAVDRE
ncbi:MAG: hypothetical protein ABFD98_17655 [Syntrophobacteraceae bacterium]|nr:hypothetical protein [Desulfobacteraceae bacterium]